MFWLNIQKLEVCTTPAWSSLTDIMRLVELLNVTAGWRGRRCVFLAALITSNIFCFMFTNLQSWLMMFGLVDPNEYDKLPLYILNASHDPNNIHTQCRSDSELHYLPESRLLDSGCPLPSRRVLPCNFRWSGLREKGRSADGWCKEKSFWMTCKPSWQVDQQEPLSLLEDEDDANEWEVSF